MCRKNFTFTRRHLRLIPHSAGYIDMRVVAGIGVKVRFRRHIPVKHSHYEFELVLNTPECASILIYHRLAFFLTSLVDMLHEGACARGVFKHRFLHIASVTVEMRNTRLGYMANGNV